LIFNSYSNYFIFQFDWIYIENNIILYCILVYFLDLLQLFDIEYFVLFKYIYSYFVNNLICIEYNYIDKFKFFRKLFSDIYRNFSEIIRNNFTTTNFISINPESIFSKFNIWFRISILPENWLNNRSSQSISKISKTVIQLQKQTRLFKNLLK